MAGSERFFDPQGMGLGFQDEIVKFMPKSGSQFPQFGQLSDFRHRGQVGREIRYLDERILALPWSLLTG